MEIKKILTVGSFLAIAFLYNNCSEKSFNLESAIQQSNGEEESVDFSKPNCGGVANGEIINFSSGQLRSKEIVCPFGGKQIIFEESSKEFICAGGEAFDLGNELFTFVREESLDCKMTEDAGNQPLACNNLNPGDKVFLIEGGISDTVNCGKGVYSAGTFTKQNPPPSSYVNRFQRKVEYVCAGGFLSQTGNTKKGNFLEAEGRCAMSDECAVGDFTYQTTAPGAFNIPQTTTITRYSNKFGQIKDILDVAVSVIGPFNIGTTSIVKYQCADNGEWKECPTFSLGFGNATTQRCE